jgi:hypothetical protein
LDSSPSTRASAERSYGGGGAEGRAATFGSWDEGKATATMCEGESRTTDTTFDGEGRAAVMMTCEGGSG